MIKEEKLYTSGKFAKKAGVTLKTIKYYNEVGLLKPMKINESGYRLYSEKEFEKLQRIITFKYLGYSLEDIKGLMNEHMCKEDMYDSIKTQRECMEEKIERMKRVNNALIEIEKMVKHNEEVQWSKYINVIESIKLDEVFKENFKTSSKLNTRVSIHDKYSVNTYGLHPWVYDNIEDLDGKRVLDIGCGSGLLWERNQNRVPESCEITLLDRSDGMIREVREKFSKDKRFVDFRVGDILDLPFEEESFDVVIANHVMYFIKDSTSALNEMKRILKKGGSLYTTTFGKGNFKEIRELLKRYNEDVILSRIDIIDSYNMENGSKKMQDVFGEAQSYIYEDSLEITQEEDLLQYVLSTTGNVKELFGPAQLKKVEEEIKKIIQTRGSYHVTKEVGMLRGCK